MNLNIPAIIVDLDGTLADITHREHYVRQIPKDWDAFSKALVNDGVNQWCADLIKAMKLNGHTILFVSGRKYESYQDTVTWLKDKIGLKEMFDYTLLIRNKNDYRLDTIVKRDIYKKRIEPIYNVSFVIEDRKRVVDMWRQLGLTCLQCKDGDY